jgi:alpha-amylase
MLRGGGEFEEGDFVGAAYRLATCDLRPEAAGSVAYVRLTREGHLLREGGEGRPHPLKLTKTYRVTPAPGAGLTVDYELAAKSTPAAGALTCRFGVELNLSAVGENDSKIHVEVAGKRHPAGDRLETGPLNGLVLVDERQGYRLEISAEPAAILWMWPLETVSQSDEGFERNRQGTVLLLSWPVSLAAGQPQRFRISLTPSPA